MSFLLCCFQNKPEEDIDPRIRRRNSNMGNTPDLEKDSISEESVDAPIFSVSFTNPQNKQTDTKLEKDQPLFLTQSFRQEIEKNDNGGNSNQVNKTDSSDYSDCVSEITFDTKKVGKLDLVEEEEQQQEQESAVPKETVKPKMRFSMSMLKRVKDDEVSC